MSLGRNLLNREESVYTDRERDMDRKDDGYGETDFRL